MTSADGLEQDEDFRRMPGALRDLLRAELMAGNQVVRVFHGHPAPPVGACFLLAKSLITRPPLTVDGLEYRARNSSLCSGEISDGERRYFLVEPPLPPAAGPVTHAAWAREDSGANRTDCDRVANTGPEGASQSRLPATGGDESLLARFRSSMVRDFEKWHDGIGYDIALLGKMSDFDRSEVERLILGKPKLEWFDVEALALLDTPVARKRMGEAHGDPDFSVRNAVRLHAPGLVSDSDHAKSLVRALREAELYGGLSQALDAAEGFHPPEVIQALLDGARDRDGETATLMAALLLYVHGITGERFDMRERPFLLRFNTADRKERAAVFEELQFRLKGGIVR